MLRNDQENKGIGRISNAWAPDIVAQKSGFQRPAFLLLAITGMVALASPAQPQVIRCVAPEPPMMDLAADVLAEYRAEIATDFENYFAEIPSFVACLDEERERALTEARRATNAYAIFLDTIPARKARP